MFSNEISWKYVLEVRSWCLFFRSLSTRVNPSIYLLIWIKWFLTHIRDFPYVTFVSFFFILKKTLAWIQSKYKAQTVSDVFLFSKKKTSNSLLVFWAGAGEGCVIIIKDTSPSNNNLESVTWRDKACRDKDDNWSKKTAEQEMIETPKIEQMWKRNSRSQIGIKSHQNGKSIEQQFFLNICCVTIVR